MKRKRWLRIDAVLGKPHQRLEARMAIVAVSELGRWVASHLNQGYMVTLTKVGACGGTFNSRTPTKQ